MYTKDNSLARFREDIVRDLNNCSSDQIEFRCSGGQRWLRHGWGPLVISSGWSGLFSLHRTYMDLPKKIKKPKKKIRNDKNLPWLSFILFCYWSIKYCYFGQKYTLEVQEVSSTAIFWSIAWHAPKKRLTRWLSIKDCNLFSFCSWDLEDLQPTHGGTSWSYVMYFVKIFT